MPIDNCIYCGNDYSWSWEEAFDKFGFMDGDGNVNTYIVREVLKNAGYEVEEAQWGLHNEIIISIKKDGKEFMPLDDENIRIGYDNPRNYLPEAIIDLLDNELF